MDSYNLFKIRYRKINFDQSNSTSFCSSEEESNEDSIFDI